MLTLESLRTMLGSLAQITEASKQIIEGERGFDGMIEAINERARSFPCVVLEDNETGEYSFNPGGMETITQRLWILDMVGSRDSRASIQRNMKVFMHDIVVTFGREYAKGKLDGLVVDNLYYGVVNGGPNLTGWELTLNFEMDVDLANMETMSTNPVTPHPGLEPLIINS